MGCSHLSGALSAWSDQSVARPVVAAQEASARLRHVANDRLPRWTGQALVTARPTGLATATGIRSRHRGVDQRRSARCPSCDPGPTTSPQRVPLSPTRRATTSASISRRSRLTPTTPQTVRRNRRQHWMTWASPPAAHGSVAEAHRATRPACCGRRGRRRRTAACDRLGPDRGPARWDEQDDEGVVVSATANPGERTWTALRRVSCDGCSPRREVPPPRPGCTGRPPVCVRCRWRTAGRRRPEAGRPSRAVLAAGAHDGPRSAGGPGRCQTPSSRRSYAVMTSSGQALYVRPLPGAVAITASRRASRAASTPDRAARRRRG